MVFADRVERNVAATRSLLCVSSRRQGVGWVFTEARDSSSYMSLREGRIFEAFTVGVFAYGLK